MTLAARLLLLVAVCCGAAVASAQEATVVTIDGATRIGKLTGLDAAKATVMVAGKPVEVAVRDLQDIRFQAIAPDVFGRPGRAIIRTTRGGWIVAEKLAIADGKITVQTALAGEAKFDLAVAADIIMSDGKMPPKLVLGRLSEMDLSDQAADHLVIRARPGQVMAVAGALRSIGKTKLAFNFDDRDRTVDVAKAMYVRLAQVGDAPKPPLGHFIGVDGSRIAFDAVAIADGKLRFTGACLGPMTLAPEAVAAILFRNENVVHLGTLEPATIVEAGTFGNVFRYRRDRSAAGKPIRLGGKTFSRGLGLHSKCVLTYKIDGTYNRLVGLVGIDDAARPGGNAVLTVTGDGKPILPATTLTGKDKPVALRLDIKGVKSLTISVDFGEDLDVADQVDLADVKLIK